MPKIKTLAKSFVKFIKTGKFHLLSPILAFLAVSSLAFYAVPGHRTLAQPDDAVVTKPEQVVETATVLPPPVSPQTTTQTPKTVAKTTPKKVVAKNPSSAPATPSTTKYIRPKNWIDPATVTPVNLPSYPVYNQTEYNAKIFTLKPSYYAWKDISNQVHVAISTNYPYDDPTSYQQKGASQIATDHMLTLPASFAEATKARSALDDISDKFADRDAEVRRSIIYYGEDRATAIAELLPFLAQFDAAIEAYRQAINASPPTNITI